MKKIILFLLVVICLAGQIVVQSGCATIIPPEGGPRDSLPPVLVEVDPADSMLHFNSKTIVFSFDEYVDADNYQRELIVSPIPANTPTVNRKLRTVTVKLRDTLEPNTTYSLNFGNTIKDVNEGNIKKNFTYIFSTGSYFDSLEFHGNVVLAETGGVDSTFTVMLHKSNLDSALIKEKPRYIAKVDSSGNFNFRNLPKDTFYVYALKDEGGSYRYLNNTMLFAFSDSAVAISTNTKPVTLYAYATKEPEKPVTPATTTGGRSRAADKRLKYTTNLKGNQQDLLDSFVFTFETPIKTFDSTKIRLTKDTTYTVLTGHTWRLDSTSKKLSLLYNWQENTEHHIIMEKDFATDTLGQQLLKGDTIDFKTKQTRDYGKVTLNFRNLTASSNSVLQFVQGSEVVKSYRLTSNSFSENLFLPGEYTLRILDDKNNNGKWDPGQFYGKRIQPEIVKPVHRLINIRAGVDNRIDIDVNAPPRPEPRSQQFPTLPGRANNPPNGRF
jgi:hypothetical protein